MILRILVFFLISSCGSPEIPEERRANLAGADPLEGKRLLFSFGCGVCHQIGGINDHPGNVAMPLKNWNEKKNIAGLLVNNPSSLIDWIMQPQRFQPESAMPALGMSEEQARDMAAYLYTQ